MPTEKLKAFLRKIDDLDHEIHKTGEKPEKHQENQESANGTAGWAHISYRIFESKTREGLLVEAADVG